MYTQCPNCRTIFEVDEDTLQASLGIVRCGNCGQRFDAWRTLSEQVPAGPDPRLPERPPESVSPVLTRRVAAPPSTATPTPRAAPADQSEPAGASPPDARLASRPGARALIAAAAGISHDAILGDPAWQVTELPVLTRIVLNEPIPPADLDATAAVLAQGMGHRPAAFDPGMPPAGVPANTAAPLAPAASDAPAPAPPAEPQASGSPVFAVGPGDAAFGLAGRTPATAVTAAPQRAAARAEAGTSSDAIATASLLRFADAAESGPAEPPAAAPIAAAASDSPPAETDARVAREPDAAPDDDQPTPAPGLPLEAADRPESRLERWLGEDSPDAEREAAALPDAPAAAAPETGAPIAPYDESPSEAAPEPSAPEPVYVAPRRPRFRAREGWWALGCTALALGLALQLAWAQRAEFVRDPATRAWALRACRQLRCHLPPIRDVDALALLARDVRPDPAQPGVLAITATLRNDAPFRQPWPLLVVRMTDIDNRVVAMRRFRPAEYLPGAARRADGIPPGATLAIAFEVCDPGRQATGFRFDFE